MHTFKGKKSIIHYNSDMSGDCVIFNKETEQNIEVSCDDILDFVAKYVKSQKISKLEQMDSKEILGLE